MAGTAGPIGYLFSFLMVVAFGFVYMKHQMLLDMLSGWVSKKTAGTPEAVRLGGPEVASLLDMLEKNNPNGLVAAVTAAREGQWSRRRFLCSELAAKVPTGLLEGWLMQNPNQPVLHLLLGYKRLEEGWQVRGGGDASTVSKERAAGKRAFGQEAAAAFGRAAILDAADPTPFVGQLAAIKLAPPADVKGHARALLGEVLRRDPENIDGIRSYLGILAPFWWGKAPQEALGEARAIAQGGVPGSVRPMAIFSAHQLEWHQRRHWGTPAEAESYFRNPAVLAELQAAYGASIGNPAYRGDAPELFNLAAFCFYLAGDKAGAKRELLRVGQRYDEYWNQLPGVKSAAEGYKRARRMAGA